MDFGHSSLHEAALHEVKRLAYVGSKEITLCSNLSNLIPKDKFDFEPFPALMEISEDEVKPILPGLLYCIADINWPIAVEMLKVLVRFPDSLVPIIKEILKPYETDEEWKFFIITHLIPELPKDSSILLVEDIKRIIDSPTDAELHGDVTEVAKDYYKQYCK